MLSTALIILLLLYTVIGVVISVIADWSGQTQTQLIYITIYTLMPLLGVFSIHKKHQLGIGLLICVFLFISVRVGSLPFAFPINAPLSLSVTYGDFVTGSGGLIDFFAIIMALLLVTLLRQIRREQQ